MRYLKRILGYCYTYVVSSFFSMFFSLKKNKVVFLSDVRDKLGGNLLYMYDYLENKDYERVVLLKGNKEIKRSLKEKNHLIKELITARYILLDDLSHEITFLKRRKGQEIVQLWHGPGAFKTFGRSRSDNQHRFLPKMSAHRNYTKCIVSSPAIRWCYAEAFSMDKRYVQGTGFPRTDCFFNQQYIEKIKNDFYQKYPKLKDKKIILFAPTYRGNSVAQASYDFAQLDLEGIYESFHDDYIFILKWHPDIYHLIKKDNLLSFDISQYPDFYYDFSHYRDINDLLILCDILITDYSSVIFDYVLLNKPLIYYVYDLDEYTSQQGRGLYYPFQNYVYGSIAKTCDELIKCLHNPTMNDEQRVDFFQQFMISCDGHSTEKTYQWIFENKEDRHDHH